MKRILILSISIAMLSSCGKKGEDKQNDDRNKPILDSTVVRTDSSPVDTRKDLPVIDEKKKSVSGEATKPATSGEKH